MTAAADIDDFLSVRSKKGDIFASVFGDGERFEVLGYAFPKPNNEQDRTLLQIRSLRTGLESQVRAYHLVPPRYVLVDFAHGQSREELLRELDKGALDEQGQRRVRRLFFEQMTLQQELVGPAARGMHLVDEGTWRRTAGHGDAVRTFLCLEMEPGADLSCKALRASAVDEVIRKTRT